MKIVDEARSILEKSGYHTSSSNDEINQFLFEDQIHLGFLAEYETLDELLKRWEEFQDRFLVQNAPKIKLEPRKTWNIYSVHITQEESDQASFRSLSIIEEDTRSTRKIVKAGVKKRIDIQQALLPLLPIQNQISLQGEDILSRLEDKIAPEGGPLTKLLDDTTAESIAEELVRRA